MRSPLLARGTVVGDDLRVPLSEDGLRDLLLQLSPSARDKLRRVLILDQPDRDAIASERCGSATQTATGGPT
jgi:hypothetical protein